MSATLSTPRTDMTDSGTDRVTEPEARAAYVTMQGRRSILAVRKRFVKERKKTPSLRTFQKWSGDHRWVALARKHDDKIVDATAAKIAKAAVAEAVSRAHQFDTLATCDRAGSARCLCHHAGSAQYFGSAQKVR